MRLQWGDSSSSSSAPSFVLEHLLGRGTNFHVGGDQAPPKNVKAHTGDTTIYLRCLSWAGLGPNPHQRINSIHWPIASAFFFSPGRRWFGFLIRSLPSPDGPRITCYHTITARGKSSSASRQKNPQNPVGWRTLPDVRGPRPDPTSPPRHHRRGGVGADEAGGGGGTVCGVR